MTDDRKNKGMARRTAHEEDGFRPFCLSVLKINLRTVAFLAVFTLVFSMPAAGGPAFCRCVPVLPGTEAWANTGTGFSIGNQPALETDRDLNRMQGQGDEQAANNQAPENVVNGGQGENIVNGQAPEGVINGGQEEIITDAPVPKGVINGGQGEDMVNAPAPEGVINGDAPQSPVEEEEARSRVNSQAAIRARSNYDPGVRIIYALACMLIVVAAWALYLQDPRNVRRFKKKHSRGRKSGHAVKGDSGRK